MTTSNFYKVSAEARQDQLFYLSSKNTLLIFGYGEDSELGGYNWRKNYDHVPTLEELKSDIHALINSETDAKILTGFSWNDIPVYLSEENQRNYKAAYDLCVQAGGMALGSLKFKMAEDENGEPIYHLFETLEEFADFYTKAVVFINTALNEGWEKKDGVDWDALLATLPDDVKR